MEGKLGAIYVKNRQIGGFLDWHVKINLVDGTKGDDRTHKLQSWKVISWAHWLTKPLLPDTKVALKLCSDSGNAYWEGVGKVSSLPTSSLHMLVHAPLEFVGNGKLEAKRAE